MPRKNDELELFKKSLSIVLARYNIISKIDEAPGRLTIEVENKTEEEVYELCYTIQEKFNLDVTKIVVEKKPDASKPSNSHINIYLKPETLANEKKQALFLFSAINQAVYLDRFKNLETLIKRGSKASSQYEDMIVVERKLATKVRKGYYESVKFKKEGTEYRTPWTFTLSLLINANDEERGQIIKVMRLLLGSHNNHETKLSEVEQSGLDEMLVDMQSSPSNSKKALQNRARAHTSPVLYLEFIRRSLPTGVYDEAKDIIEGREHSSRRHTR